MREILKFLKCKKKLFLNIMKLLAIDCHDAYYMLIYTMYIYVCNIVSACSPVNVHGVNILKCIIYSLSNMH